MAQSMSSDMKEKLEEQIGECIGLERAAQTAVEELSAKGLLEGVEEPLQRMKEEASGHEDKLEELIQTAKGSHGLDNNAIEQHAAETVQKASEMMKTYLGNDPDKLDALEFLCLAEGGEVTHYEVLGKLAGKARDRKLATRARSILDQEKKHLRLCTKLAKENSVG
jgi:ferritin-like metal-binding protein YciE